MSTLLSYPSCLFTHTPPFSNKYSICEVSILQFHGVIKVIVFLLMRFFNALFCYVLCPLYHANISNCVIVFCIDVNCQPFTAHMTAIRLYTEEYFLNHMPNAGIPEIQRSNMVSCVIQVSNRLISKKQVV